jgi:hypothetical protein
MILGKYTNLDDDYDPFSWDTSYYTAIAYSGSDPWDNADIEKRREFWMWYINEAVPKVYLAFQS